MGGLDRPRLVGLPLAALSDAGFAAASVLAEARALAASDGVDGAAVAEGGDDGGAVVVLNWATGLESTYLAGLLLIAALTTVSPEQPDQ